MFKKWLVMLAFMQLSAVIVWAQSGLNEGVCTSPLGYFDQYQDGYIVLKDGSRVDGRISLKSFDKSGRVILSSRSGTEYEIDTRSLNEWGLTQELPFSHSPMTWYDWKNKKCRENDHAERGMVELKSGEVLDGKIRIEGSSLITDRLLKNYFALEKLTFSDNAGKETEYKASDVKSFARIMPWSLTPPEMYQWQSGEFMGKKKTKWMPGYCITNDGRRIDGELQLIVKNKLETRSGNGKNNDHIRNNIVDDLKFQRDGKDEKISLDDVFAYGLSGMTINTLTNNRDRLYTQDEMNFHQGTIELANNTVKQGYFAYFPEPGNYYGVYFANKADEPVTIIPMKEIRSAKQDIAEIEAFNELPDGEPAKKANNSINGYIVTNGMKKVEGTVKLLEDNGFWVRSIEFTDKDGRIMKYGGDKGGIIAYFMINDQVYVQHGALFMKAEKKGEHFVAYNYPYPDNSTAAGRFALGLGKQLVQDIATDIAFRAAVSANSPVKNGQFNMNKFANNAGFAYNVGIAAGNLFDFIVSRQQAAKQKEPYRIKKGEDMLIYNLHTAESVRSTNESDVEVLLESTSKYWNMGKSEKKQIKGSGTLAIADFLNTAYSK